MTKTAKKFGGPGKMLATCLTTGTIITGTAIVGTMLYCKSKYENDQYLIIDKKDYLPKK